MARPRPRAETGYLDDAETRRGRLRQPGPLRALRGPRPARRAGVRVGFVRPITLWPFPTDVVADAAAACPTVAVFELCAGQMIDDVRLAVLGRAPVVGIGGI